MPAPSACALKFSRASGDATMLRTLLALAALAAATFPAVAETEARIALPKSGILKVAFVVSDNATLIDIAGPMQVFDQVQTPNGGFQTFTVSETRAPIHAGTMTVVPDYTFENAPDADVVVVGAQSGRNERYLGYLRRMSGNGKLMLSVCTGASKFAQAGLLDGLQATTHHDYVDLFQKTYPRVHFLRDKAWVHSAPRIYTAGGETSGIELALHIVELTYDHATAVRTARYMEYRGPDWQK
jgi:transcriptional regulator GlxA family with amidase domain